MNQKRLTGLLLCALAACDSTSPASDGPRAEGEPFAYGRSDGAFFEFHGGTFGTVLASSTDTIVILSMVTSVSPTETHAANIYLDGWREGSRAIGDTTSIAYGEYIASQQLGDTARFVESYTSGRAPGRLVITDINRADSLIAGTASFKAGEGTDASPLRSFSITFRMRYSMYPLAE